MSFGQRILGKTLFERLLRKTMYSQFVAGENLPAIQDTIEMLHKCGIGTMLCVPNEEDLSSDYNDFSSRSVLLNFHNWLFHSNCGQRKKLKKKNQFQSVKCWKADSTTLHFFSEHSFACESSNAKDVSFEWWFRRILFVVSKVKTTSIQWRIQGRSPGPPLILRTNWGPKGWKNFFETRPPHPLSQGLDGWTPQLSNWVWLIPDFYQVTWQSGLVNVSTQIGGPISKCFLHKSYFKYVLILFTNIINIFTCSNREEMFDRNAKAILDCIEKTGMLWH